jgi:hypothetical protein
VAAQGLHLTAACGRCGREYRQSRSDQVFCSQACAHADWLTRQPNYNSSRRIVRHPCKQCGEIVVAPRIKFCSPECRTKSLRKGTGKNWSKGVQYVPRRPCTVCGAAFYAPPSQVKRGGGKFCSTECSGRFAATHPECYPHLRTRRGKGGRRADLDNRYFRSSWEANWARYLNWLQARGDIRSWEYEAITFEFTKIKRGTRFYTPDFRVTNGDGSIELHEIKGYMDAKSQTSLDRMARYYPDVKLLLVDKNQYRAVANVVAGMIPTWEKQRGQAFRRG